MIKSKTDREHLAMTKYQNAKIEGLIKDTPENWKVFKLAFEEGFKQGSIQEILNR